MKRILVLATALLMVSGFAIVEAQDSAGPFCFDMTVYCDGMELSLDGPTKTITGFWVNLDCVGGRAPITWGKFMTPGPLGDGAYWMANYSGFDWAWFMDFPMDGTFDMYQYSGGWNLWIPNVTYAMTPGPCPFDDNIGDPKNAATWVE